LGGPGGTIARDGESGAESLNVGPTGAVIHRIASRRQIFRRPQRDERRKSTSEKTGRIPGGPVHVFPNLPGTEWTCDVQGGACIHLEDTWKIFGSYDKVVEQSTVGSEGERQAAGGRTYAPDGSEDAEGRPGVTHELALSEVD